MGRTEFFVTLEFQVTYRWINKLNFYLELLLQSGTDPTTWGKTRRALGKDVLLIKTDRV